MKYWNIELTLTSGRVLDFYVKARNDYEALEKADGYADLAENDKLMYKLSTFKLMV